MRTFEKWWATEYPDATIELDARTTPGGEVRVVATFLFRGYLYESGECATAELALLRLRSVVGERPEEVTE